MEKEIDVQQVVSDLQNPVQFLEKLLDNLDVEDKDISTIADFHLYIKQILWNEIEELDTEQVRDILLGALALYYTGDLHKVDIRSFLSQYYFQNLLDPYLYTSIIFLVLIYDRELPSNIVEFLRHNMKDYGVNHLDLTAVVELAEEFGQNTEKFDILVSKFESFKNRPEYLQDIIDNTDIEDLISLQYWVEPKIKSSIVDTILQRKREIFDTADYQEGLQQFKQDNYLNQFPLNHNILADKMANFEPREMNMDEINDLSPELSRKWLPNFVYSKPELEENIRIYFPGGPHIGHSAIIVKSNFGSIMMDYGLSVVNTSKSRWLPVMEKLDFILISHAHLDHSGSLPILYGKERKIPWFGLEETKIMTEMLWADTRNILSRYVSPDLIDRQPYLRKLVSKGGIINTINNFSPIEVEKEYAFSPTTKVKAYDAAHLFGSVGYEITIGGKRILYTGDFNLDKGVKFPTDADITLFDSTYFERYQDYPKPEEGLQSALDSSERILIPAFSMGRSQEILFKLKQLGAEKNWDIYLTGMGGRLATKLNLSVGSNRGAKQGGVNIVPTVKPEEFVEKTIVIGGQGMIQAGTSRNLFEHSKDDDNTSVILCGYQAPNTLGYHLLRNDNYLLGKYRQEIKRIKLSGHTSGEQLDKFMDDLANQKVMVHTPEGAYENRKRQDVTSPVEINSIDL